MAVGFKIVLLDSLGLILATLSCRHRGHKNVAELVIPITFVVVFGYCLWADLDVFTQHDWLGQFNDWPERAYIWRAIGGIGLLLSEAIRFWRRAMNSQ